MDWISPVSHHLLQISHHEGFATASVSVKVTFSHGSAPPTLAPLFPLCQDPSGECRSKHAIFGGGQWLKYFIYLNSSWEENARGKREVDREGRRNTEGRTSGKGNIVAPPLQLLPVTPSETAKPPLRNAPRSIFTGAAVHCCANLREIWLPVISRDEHARVRQRCLPWEFVVLPARWLEANSINHNSRTTHSYCCCSVLDACNLLRRAAIYALHTN